MSLVFKLRTTGTRGDRVWGAVTHLFLKMVDAPLTFEVDEQDQAQKVVLYQDDQDVPAPRTSE